MIELVVFDMAGTTVHDGFAVNTCFRSALAAVNVYPELGSIDAVMGLSKPEAIRLLLQAAKRRCDNHEIDAIHNDFSARMQRYYASDPAVREIPGATKVFAELRRAGIKVALNTGFDHRTVDVLLKRLKWSAAVDGVVASDEVLRGRPHPDMIRHLMALLGVANPKHVAKVGDTLVDLEEGRNAGCGLVVGVTTGTFSRKQLEKFPSAVVVDSIVDVSALLL